MRIFSDGVMAEQFGYIPIRISMMLIAKRLVLNNLKKVTNIISRHKIICTSKVENDLKSLLISNN